MSFEEAEKGEFVPVIYVARQDAKKLKTFLEFKGLMNKNFRMTKAAPNIEMRGICLETLIAIPVLPACTKSLLDDFSIEGLGQQFCPYSTAVLGNQAMLHVRKKGSQNLSPVQRALLNSSRRYSGTEIDEKTLLESILALPQNVCPPSLELFGDDRSLVIPEHALNPALDETFSDWIKKLWETDSEVSGSSEQAFFRAFLQRLWKELSIVYKSPRIFRRGGVDPDSRIRQSGFTMLWPFVELTNNSRGPQSPAWITVTENGIRQSFDVLRIMFSRGNISEKIRFGQLVQKNELVLDLYAGIGYFTLPAIVHGKAKHVYACEWNPDAVEALKYNLRDNNVDDRATVLIGDCRITAREKGLVDLVDRVSLGLLPSSEGAWQTAVRALRRSRGGWLHVHANVPSKEVGLWSQWLCVCLSDYAKEEGLHWSVLLWHVENVKSFAPTIFHYVADVLIGPRQRLLDWTGGEVMVEVGEAGILQSNRKIETCPKRVDPPSCALSPDGALHQSWMREEYDKLEVDKGENR